MWLKRWHIQIIWKCEDEPETFFPTSVSKNPYKNLGLFHWDWWKGIQNESKDRKIINKKRIFSCPRESKEFEVVTTDRRPGSRQIIVDYYEELVKI